MGSRFAKMGGGRNPSGRLTVHDQLFRMRFTWPTFESTVQSGRLMVSGTVQPTSMSEIYRVRIEYSLGGAPKAYVVSPRLRPHDNGEPIPHVYPGPRPCLYLPDNDEWTAAKPIATTIVPWLILWLFYYEVWHATGEWLGGGAHPSLPDEK